MRPGGQLESFQFVVHGGKIRNFVILPCKGAYHAGTHIIFAGQQGHFVQRILGGAVLGTVTRMISQTTSEMASVTSTNQNPMVG